MQEEFKNIKIHNRELEVSNLGQVFYQGKELRQNTNHDGYKVVYVGNNRSMGVHRLVALAFVNNDYPEIRNEVNHLDFNRQNNIHTNLEWVTHRENIAYSKSNNRYIGKFGNENPNYGNKKLSDFYNKNPEIAIEKQSRKGVQNGSSKPITLIKDGKELAKFNYIGECCSYLHKNFGFSSNAETVRCGIRRSIKNDRPYNGFKFKK